eukprot:6212119-Pleurochrysis_carterae.AAC.4
MTIFGMMVVNAYVLYNYFVSDAQYDEIKAFLRAAAFDGLHNHFDEPTLPMRISPASSSAAASSTPRGPALFSPTGRDSSPRRVARLHVLGSIAHVKGWKGHAQQKCAVCKKQVSYCCMYCSSDPDAVGILPLHKEKYHKDGSVVMYRCMAIHQANVDKHPRCRPAPSRQGKREKKRARREDEE